MQLMNSARWSYLYIDEAFSTYIKNYECQKRMRDTLESMHKGRDKVGKQEKTDYCKSKQGKMEK